MNLHPFPEEGEEVNVHVLLSAQDGCHGLGVEVIGVQSQHLQPALVFPHDLPAGCQQRSVAQFVVCGELYIRRIEFRRDDDGVVMVPDNDGDAPDGIRAAMYPLHPVCHIGNLFHIVSF